MRIETNLNDNETIEYIYFVETAFFLIDSFVCSERIANEPTVHPCAIPFLSSIFSKIAKTSFEDLEPLMSSSYVSSNVLVS